jgi:predicted nucleic acid-binding protein
MRVGEVGISVITACELAYGVTKSGSARNRSALETFLLPLEIAAFDDTAVWRYADLRAELERQRPADRRARHPDRRPSTATPSAPTSPTR